MINDIFMNFDRRIGSALYAANGAIWIRVRESSSVLDKMKEAIVGVEQWSNGDLSSPQANHATCCSQEREGCKVSSNMDKQWRRIMFFSQTE